jgi:hypothetical protein
MCSSPHNRHNFVQLMSLVNVPKPSVLQWDPDPARLTPSDLIGSKFRLPARLCSSFLEISSTRVDSTTLLPSASLERLFQPDVLRLDIAKFMSRRFAFLRAPPSSDRFPSNLPNLTGMRAAAEAGVTGDNTCRNLVTNHGPRPEQGSPRWSQLQLHCAAAISLIRSVVHNFG